MNNQASHPLPQLRTQGFTPPLSLADFKLAAFDMDSTLISIECIDEIAALAGKGAEVAAITEAAMRGEIADFRESLARRLALLAGTPASVLHRVLAERLAFNPGARELCAALKAAGLKLVLVSGGFTFFTAHVAQELGMDFVRSNELEIEGGRLTGRVVMQDWGDVCDGAEKRRMLLECCAAIGCTPAQAMAVGDGKQRSLDDGRGRALGGLPRQAPRARGGHGGDQRRRPGSVAVGVRQHLNFLPGKGHALPGADLGGLAQLQLAVHPHFARRNAHAGFAAAADEADGLEQLVQLDVIGAQFKFMHGGPVLARGWRSGCCGWWTRPRRA